MRSLKCPECGATLEIEESRDMAYCTYCGAKVTLVDQEIHIKGSIGIDISDNSDALAKKASDF